MMYFAAIVVLFVMVCVWVRKDSGQAHLVKAGEKTAHVVTKSAELKDQSVAEVKITGAAINCGRRAFVDAYKASRKVSKGNKS